MTRRSWLPIAMLACVAMASTAEAAPKKKKKPTTTAAASEPAAPTDENIADFDRNAASSAISEVSLARCKATNAAHGDGHVTITFGAGGTANSATVDKGPWVGTPVAKCMAKEFKKTKVPAFKGDPVTVGKTFHFE